MIFRCNPIVFSLAFLLGSFSLLSCTDTEEGITLSLGAVHHASPDSGGDIDVKPSDEPRVFTNNLGYDITLTSGYVVLSKSELHECETARLIPRLFEWLSPIGLAHAHSEGSPTELGVPSVVNLLAQDLEFLPLGEIDPPAGTYCHLHLTLAPADDDALGLPSAVDMVGKTFVLSGEYVPSGGGSAQSFSVESTSDATSELELDDLVLSKENPDQTVTVGMIYDKLFEDVDFDNMSADEISDQVLANSAAALERYTGSYTTQ